MADAMSVREASRVFGLGRPAVSKSWPPGPAGMKSTGAGPV